MRLHKFLTYLSAIALMAAAAGCASDGHDEPSQGTRAEISIKAVSVDDEATENELINSWWIAFVDKDRKVRAIVGNTHTPAVESDVVNTDNVPRGTYSLYAFANVTPEEVTEATGLEFTVGKGIASHNDIMSKTWDMNVRGLNAMEETDQVPMTGFLNGVKITNEYNKSYSVEVVRMVAKMQFSFTSASNKDVTVHNAILNDYSLKPIKAFPTYSSLGFAPDFIQDGTTPTAFEFFPSDNSGQLTVPAKSETAQIGWFYLRECISEKDMRLGLKVSYADKPKHDVNFTVTGLSHVNRNDFIKIPLKFTDDNDKVTVTPTFYPPIGGYPAMIVVDEENASIVTFKTQGAFILTAAIEKADGTKVTGSDIAFAELISVTGDNGIFTTIPKLSASTCDITGDVGNTPGTAVLKVRIKVRVGYDQTTGVAVWQDYPGEYTVTIIRAD